MSWACRGRAEALARDAEQVLEAEGRDGAGEGCGHCGPWVARVGQRRLLYVLLELEGRQDVAQGEPVAGWSLRRPLEGPLAHETCIMREGGECHAAGAERSCSVRGKGRRGGSVRVVLRSRCSGDCLHRALRRSKKHAR